MASVAAQLRVVPLKTIFFTTTLLLGVGASRLRLKKLIFRSLTGPGSYSRITAIIVLLANLKNVPLVWHFRVFNSMFKHILFSPLRIPPLPPSVLFLPVISTSHAPLAECDYNIHKSNSTYFSDLDITRSHLLCCLFQPGLNRIISKRDEVLDKSVTGRFTVGLGGTMCSFKREISMYEGYEMWSRLLCWDRKWFYIVSHFVKKGTVRPSSYILSDGSWFGGKGYQNLKSPASENDDIEENAIYASAISKYVFKIGRRTMHPEVFLQASDLLPERPGGWHGMDGRSGESTPDGSDMDASHVVVENEDEADTNDEWDWKRVVAENERGLKYAEHFAALEGLIGEFSGSKTAALGRYRDFLI